MSDFSLSEPTTSCASSPDFPKMRREHIARLTVETELCPQVLLRVLGILAARGTIPFTIAACRDDRLQWIEIEIAKPDEQVGLLVLQKLRGIINVRRADLGNVTPIERLPLAAKL